MRQDKLVSGALDLAALVAWSGALVGSLVFVLLLAAAGIISGCSTIERVIEEPWPTSKCPPPEGFYNPQGCPEEDVETEEPEESADEELPKEEEDPADVDDTDTDTEETEEPEEEADEEVEPLTCYTGPWAMECKFNSCDIQREPKPDKYGAAVRDAITAAGFGHTLIPESAVWTYTQAVVKELNKAGWCADYHRDDSGEPGGNKVSHDEIAVWPAGGSPVTKEHMDLCVSDRKQKGFCWIDSETRGLVARGWPLGQAPDEEGRDEEEVSDGTLCPGTLPDAKPWGEKMYCGDGDHWIPVLCDRPTEVHPDARNAGAYQKNGHHWYTRGDRCQVFGPKEGKCYSGADGTPDGKVSSRQGFGPQIVVDKDGLIVRGNRNNEGKTFKDVLQVQPGGLKGDGCVPVW